MTGVERARRGLTSAIPAAARSARSVETRQSILEASERVLERVGYAAFTSRKVAEEAGIAIGNLTYHFPSKAALTEALIEHVLAGYVDRIAAPHQGIESGRPVGDLMRWLIEDAVAPRTTRLCRELWALACHQPIAAEALDRFYRRATRAGVVVVKGSNGAVDERTATELAYLMAMISEGAVVLFGTLPEADRVLPGVQDMAARAVEYLARTLPARAAAVPLPATASASDQ